jgi:hypothetical protein
MRNLGGFFMDALEGFMIKDYAKKPLTYLQQLDLLQ